MVSKLHVLATVGLGAITAIARGQVDFYVSPGADPAGDLAFQAALGVPLLHEFDFEDFKPCDDAPVLRTKDLEITLKLLDKNWSEQAVIPSIYNSAIFIGDGVMFQNSLLNGRSYYGCGEVAQKFPLFEFSFTFPVKGFGAYFFDDDPPSNSQVVLHVFDQKGKEFISPPVDDPNAVPFNVDGFLGAVSAQGIKRVVVEVQDLNGVMDDWEFVEIDHIQVAIDLPLDAEPDTAASGVNVDLTTSGGEPGQPGLIAIVDVNGTPTFFAIALTTFDGNGEIALGGPVPPGLAGVTETFLSFGFVPSGLLAVSNRELMTFL